MKTIDVVVPCYNEESVIDLYYEESWKVFSSIEGYKFTYIFVDDGSTDGTYQKMLSLAGQHDNVKYVSFSRNFGKESAMYAGLSASSAEYVIIMDGDLEHPPALVPKMIEEIEKGYDCCATARKSRTVSSGIKSKLSSLYYKINNMLCEVEMPQNAQDFRIMTRQMVDNILRLSEVDRFSKGIFAWVGFNTSWIESPDVERPAGETKWNLMKLVRYAISGFTNFSTVFLRALKYPGIILLACGIVTFIVELIKNTIKLRLIPEITLIVILILIIGGIIQISLGIIGEYIAKMHLEIKNRPIFIVKDTNIIK